MMLGNEPTPETRNRVIATFRAEVHDKPRRDSSLLTKAIPDSSSS